ncbi:MAG: hypothetical protein BRC27_00375 [Nanohaloarchaea archaeon SW_10_44_10]|nr:MAG: hypothetical protein BRC27_00375 [Nanohaloarchaea archaeon SW_10_44_10]
MPINPKKLEALKEIAATLPEECNWAAFGSVDSALRGVEVEPNDIDLLMKEDAANEFRKIFNPKFVETEKMGLSQIDRYRINGEDVEVIYSRTKEDDQEPLVEWEEIKIEKTENGVPLLPIDRIIKAYRKIDKTDRAKELEKLE